MKVLRSILSPVSIINQVKDDYGINGKITCSLLKACGSNDIYKITCNHNVYILKVFSKRICWAYNEEHYNFESELQTYLLKNKISTSCPIKNKCGKFVSTIDAPEYKKFYTLYFFSNGTKWQHKCNTNSYLNLLGASLARFHQVAKGFKPTYIRKLDYEFLIVRCLKNIHNYGNISSRKIINTIEDTAYKLEEKTKLATIKLQYGIIHGDFHAGNQLYDNNKTITFLDFELCGYGYFIYELAVFKWDLLNSHSQKFADNVINKVIAGYLTIDNSIKESIEYLDLFVAIRNFFMLGSSFLFYPEIPQFNSERVINKYLNQCKLALLNF